MNQPSNDLNVAGSRPVARQGVGEARAFTLIELLVVIAIIAILAAMLLPVLATAKNRALKTVDLNNHHQLLVAMVMYAGDNSDSMADSGWGGGTCWAYRAPVPGGGNSTTGESLQQYTTNDSVLQADAFLNGLLGPYVKSPKIMLCPADKVDDNFLKRKMQMTSYTWNGAVNNYSGATNAVKITLLRPEYMLQWETDETMPFYFNDACNYPDEGISGRHGKAATVGLIGGSTTTIFVRDWYKPYLAGPAGQNPQGSGAVGPYNPLWWGL